MLIIIAPVWRFTWEQCAADIAGSLLDLKWQRIVGDTRWWWIHDRWIRSTQPAIQFGRQIEYRFGGPHNRWLYRITLLGPVRGSDAPWSGHAMREAGCPAVGGLVRIVWFVGNFRLLIRPEGRAWLMLRLGPLDSGVWLFAGICYLYKARLRRKPSLATCRIDRIWG